MHRIAMPSLFILSMTAILRIVPVDMQTMSLSQCRNCLYSSKIQITIHFVQYRYLQISSAVFSHDLLPVLLRCDFGKLATLIPIPEHEPPRKCSIHPVANIHILQVCNFSGRVKRFRSNGTSICYHYSNQKHILLWHSTFPSCNVAPKSPLVSSQFGYSILPISH